MGFSLIWSLRRDLVNGYFVKYEHLASYTRCMEWYVDLTIVFGVEEKSFSHELSTSKAPQADPDKIKPFKAIQFS